MCRSAGSQQINLFESEFQASIHNTTIKCTQDVLVLSKRHHSLQSWSIEPRGALCTGSCILLQSLFLELCSVHFLLVFSILHTEGLECSSEPHTEGRLPVYVVIRGEEEKERDWDFFFLSKNLT